MLSSKCPTCGTDKGLSNHNISSSTTVVFFYENWLTLEIKVKNTTYWKSIYLEYFKLLLPLITDFIMSFPKSKVKTETSMEDFWNPKYTATFNQISAFSRSCWFCSDDNISKTNTAVTCTVIKRTRLFFSFAIYCSNLLQQRLCWIVQNLFSGGWRFKHRLRQEAHQA